MIIEQNNLTTVRQNPDAAAELVMRIKSQKPLPPEAQKHVDAAFALRTTARHLANAGDTLGSADTFFQATDEYLTAKALGANDQQTIQTAGKSQIEAEDQVINETLKRAYKENPDAGHIITRKDAEQIADFSIHFHQKPGWKQVIANVGTLFRTREKDPGFSFPDTNIKGSRLQIEVAETMGANRVRAFEESFTPQGHRENNIDIATTDNVAVECKNYGEKSIKKEEVKTWLQQAEQRLTPNSQGQVYTEVVIVVPDNVLSKAKRFFDQLAKSDFKKHSGKIKLSGASDINETLKEK